MWKAAIALLLGGGGVVGCVVCSGLVLVWFLVVQAEARSCVGSECGGNENLNISEYGIL